MKEGPVIINRYFRDLHELESSEFGWNLPVQKISLGNFYGSASSIKVEGVSVVDARFSGTLLQNGLSPEGCITFAIPAIDTQGFWWHYRKVDPNMLLSFPQSRKLKAISYDDFHVYTLSIEKQFLECLVDRFEFHGILEKFGGVEKVIPIGKGFKYNLNSLLQAIFLKVRIEEGSTLPRSLKNSVLYKLTEMVLEQVHKSDDQYNIPIQRERDHSVLKAIEFILSQDLKTLSIEEIASKTGVKKRSLEYAFKEYVSVGPKSFIKALRLNDFREALRKGELSVSEAAYQHDFNHLGQLSRDYKLLFGELPSETLRRVNRVPPGTFQRKQVNF